VLAKALLATVTRAFSLRSGVPRETVADAAYPHYVQAAALMLRDNQSADEAIPLFEKAIELDPNSALPYAGLAGAELQKFAATQVRKWLDLAGAHVAKAKSLNPDSAAVLVISGALQQRHGWYEQAIAEFQRATEIDPGNPEAWRSLAEAYENTNRAADAAATYRKAIETQPGYFRHYVSFGNFYLFRNQFREAEEQYRRVTEVAPRLASGHMNLGLALLQQGKYQEAEASLLAALSLRKTPRLLMNIGALYFHQERFEESVRYFEEAVAAGPVSAVAHLDLGDAYRQLGRTREAAEAYRRARTEAETNVGRNPRDGFARSLLALAAARLGDARRAEIEIAQALASAPENAMVMREAVVTYEALGRREQSLEVLRRAPRFTLDDLSRHPDVKPLRQDPAFQALLSNSAPEQRESENEKWPHPK
jgi:tetratricopeptide (TPR) repeat protein